MTEEDPYVALQRIARRPGQRGHFTSAQAQAAQISRMQLSRLVASGLVVRVAPRVYRFRVTAAATWKDHLAVKLLSTGGTASGLSAVALYDLVSPPDHPTVLVDRGSRTKSRGVHTTRDLPRHERVVVDDLRCLAPMRAILDSVHLLPEPTPLH